MVCCGLVAFASCEKKVTTEDPSTITYYVSFEMNGDETMLVPINSTFTDPGIVATENGANVNDKVVVTITDAASREVPAISTTAAGMYTISYSAVNKDGFGSETSRKVFVYDPAITKSIAGTYSVDVTQTIYGSNPFSAYIAANGWATSAKVVVTEVAPGFFKFDDLLAGWYGQIRGYGNSYYMSGTVTLNADNSLTLLESYIKGWGDGLDWIKNAVWDEINSTIKYDASYSGSIKISPVLVKQ